MKKTVSILLLLSLLLCLSSCEAISFPQDTLPQKEETEEIKYEIIGEETAPETEAENSVVWSFDSETGVLTLSGRGKMEDYSAESPAPWYDYRNTVKKVIFEEGITGIGAWAFNSCMGLAEVTVADSVTEIGDCAFLTCRALTSISKSGTLTYLGRGAFEGCSALTAVTLPGGYTELLGNTFAFCTSLSEFYVPEGVTKIGNSAFNGCTALQAISLPAGLTSVGEGVFFNCNMMSSVTFRGTPEQWSAITFGVLCEKVKDASVSFEN